MEEDQEVRFERYPCGKSLGCHMRSHLIPNSAESDEKFDPNVTNFTSMKDPSFELGGQSGYGLRENPKRTWRAVGSKSPLKQKDQVCKQCGKGFQSLKALCGHMACHSEKDKVLKDDHSWTSEREKILMDSQSDTEAAVAPRRPKRAASMRCQRIVLRSSSFANGSTVSEIDQEQEEVAMCLMMLSRDSENWVSVNSVAESSDTISVVLETKSSSIDMRIGNKKGFNCGDEPLEIRKLGKGKLKSGVWDARAAQYENSDSGYFLNGPKKVDSDVSVDGFSKFSKKDLFKKQKVEGGSRFKVKYDEAARIGSNPAKCDSSKRSKYECSGKKKQDFGKRRLKSKSKKSKGHECPICHRVFKSGQALGGHKRSHFLGVSEVKSNETPVRNQEHSEIIPDLLDLNLPAPEMEEEANEDSQFMPW